MPQIFELLILARIRQRYRIDSRLLRLLHQFHCYLMLDTEFLGSFPNRRIHILAVADLTQQILYPLLRLTLPPLSRNTSNRSLIPQARTFVILIHTFQIPADHLTSTPHTLL